MAANAEPSLPDLSFKAVTNENEKQEALRLVADSIAQQRQVASNAIIFHPLWLASLGAVSLLAWHFQSGADIASKVILQSGLVITYLAAVQYCTSGYIQRAEAFNWRTWITAPNGDEDTVLVAQYGPELIGTLVLRLTRADKDGKQARGDIRAWTTKLRYRGKGIGGDLLREAVCYTCEKFGRDAEVEFAQQHANEPIPRLQGRLNPRLVSP
ncbi:hypothetical protein K4F52_001654 [Lecanicillium sp. MT-2017a]|nr:hypothetical protein K4F52_001654 [Lecanicillium sp. MT-2017a]